MSKIIKKITCHDQEIILLDLLAKNLTISKEKIKKAGNCGGIWIQKNGKTKKARIRKIKSTISLGDKIDFYYDPAIETAPMDSIYCIQENKHWGAWYKPANVLPQGTLFGDTYSLQRHVEKIKSKAFLVHRLDRETSGIMLIAYTGRAAAQLSELFATGKINKCYQAEVLGLLNQDKIMIETPLDEKSSKSEVRLFKKLEHTSLVEVVPHTGRFHQIRRHLDSIKHPVIGDPVYGKGNKNKDGLKLVSNKLDFFDPISNRTINLKLENKDCLF